MNIFHLIRFIRNKIKPSAASMVLNKAADLIEQPGAWTQGVYAKDAEGRGVGPRSPKAVSFCLAGAMENTAANNMYLEAAAREGFKSVYKVGMATFNDAPTRTQEEVVAAARHAAKFI